MHMWSYRNCDSIPRVCTGPNQMGSHAEMGKWAQAPIPNHLSLGYCCYDKALWPKAILGGGLFGLHCHIHYRNSNKAEPRCRSWYRDHGVMLLTGLLPIPCSACFPLEQELKPMDDHTQNHLRKYSTDLPIAQSYGGIFSIGVPSSQKTLAYIKFT